MTFIRVSYKPCTKRIERLCDVGYANNKTIRSYARVGAMLFNLENKELIKPLVIITDKKE